MKTFSRFFFRFDLSHVEDLKYKCKAFYEDKDPGLIQIENEHKWFIVFIKYFEEKYCNHG
jgi:hypothetical protein